MARSTRRTFLTGSMAAIGAGFAIGGTKASGRILGANDTINLAVAGLNGRGGAHVGEFSGMEGVRITHLVDPDIRTFDKRVKQVSDRSGNSPKTVQDIRQVLDDPDVHAVSIATPNHWHSLMAVWACQAGKDVYVEKPCSHNIHEGRVAVEAARKYDRIVQHGTQSRSSRSWAELAELSRSGKYGPLLVSRALCYKPRNSIGFKPTGPAPSEVDFSLWLGPAQDHPFHENLVHYNWHWFWDFGNGDIGNQGVHQMDIARWMIPGPTYPTRVVSLGGRFGYEDQGETPNTQITVMDYGDTQLVFEVRGLETGEYRGEKVGNILHFEEGTVAGGKFYPKGSDEAEPLVEVEVERGPGDGHFGNFIAAVRSRKKEDLNAEILEGHVSSALCHLANLSYRVGEPRSFDTVDEALGTDDVARETVGRMCEHLKDDNGLSLDGMQYRLGRNLRFDGDAERFINDPQADELLSRDYRAPFVVPETLA
ncbi:Gfo/Idh/MocA family protein [Tautonia plasticadhaerens]|uniref:Inositol 2-dehydrogenase n=1 Tax=Tautonia plasticadhaerens TaxID=2527974 RepID=A0A518GY56_9BACT|nr:Gfo/Idh/MocA family oxidoreductase [Tautonia plasticadhaerens]QDV33534.1 Inositol 2-dehydrogenase [Tautonia plasticadhaerens]